MAPIGGSGDAPGPTYDPSRVNVGDEAEKDRKKTYLILSEFVHS